MTLLTPYCLRYKEMVPQSIYWMVLYEWNHVDDLLTDCCEMLESRETRNTSRCRVLHTVCNTIQYLYDQVLAL